MPQQYDSRNVFGKQKVYGKPIKSHLSIQFGRRQWLNLEKNEHSNNPEIVSKTPSTISRRRSGDKVYERIIPEESPSPGDLVEARDQDADDFNLIISQTEKLAISEEPAFESEERNQSTINEIDEFQCLSLTSSLNESSDKENEPDLAPYPLTTLHKSYTSEKEISPSKYLAERQLECIKQSPPRRWGLRKSCSIGTSPPSPLKSGLAIVTPVAPESDINVYEDSIEELGLVKTRLPVAVVEDPVLEYKPSSSTSWHDKEPDKTIEIAVLCEKIADPKSYEIFTENIEETLIEYKLLESPGDSPVSFGAKEANAGKHLLHSHSRESGTREIDILETDTSETNTSQTSLKEVAGLSATNQLLSLCSNPSVLNFTTYIDSLLEGATIRKLGEASYSEVFLYSPNDAESTTVLKVIPFGNEEQCKAKEILQEVRITKAMASIKGFIGFRGAYLVKGFFPEALLNEWDFYDESREYGSENERPDQYDEDQLFAIILLENGGSDLEHTELNGWEEACDIFWQVSLALARGEKERKFEHRDLHYGNIVIKRRNPKKVEPKDQNPENLIEKLSLEDSSPLQVSLIDYTLSRAYCGDLSGGRDIEFMPLDDPALFEGKGDYQFDIYRFMRSELSTQFVTPEEESIDWNVFCPRTNVIWLHYLTDILLTRMGLRRPAARGRFAASTEEVSCFKQLEAVGKCIDPRKNRLDDKAKMESVIDLLRWAVVKGFLSKMGDLEEILQS